MSGSALRDYWHPVALSSEVTDRPLASRLLDEPIVLFRAGGRPVALRDRCVHRGTPLSMGWVEGDTITCTYHGWSYNAEGACVRIPSVSPARAIPHKARVNSYQVQERYGLVWVCLGEPRLPIADYPEFDDPTYRTFFCGQDEWRSSAARLVENFVDVSHFPWVHVGVIGDRAASLCPPITVERVPTGLRVDLDMETPDGFFRHGSYHSSYDVMLPFTVRLVRTNHDGGHHVLFLAVKPVSSKQLKRFLYSSRDCDVERQDEYYAKMNATVANQDKAIVEAQRPEELPTDLAEELHIGGPDGPAVAYRRLLAEIGVE